MAMPISFFLSLFRNFTLFLAVCFLFQKCKSVNEERGGLHECNLGWNLSRVHYPQPWVSDVAAGGMFHISHGHGEGGTPVLKDPVSGP